MSRRRARGSATCPCARGARAARDRQVRHPLRCPFGGGSRVPCAWSRTPLTEHGEARHLARLDHHEAVTPPSRNDYRQRVDRDRDRREDRAATQRQAHRAACRRLPMDALGERGVVAHQTWRPVSLHTRRDALHAALTSRQERRHGRRRPAPGRPADTSWQRTPLRRVPLPRRLTCAPRRQSRASGTVTGPSRLREVSTPPERAFAQGTRPDEGSPVYLGEIGGHPLGEAHRVSL